MDNKNTVKLSELINWVKKELLSDEARRNDPVPLFVIDEVTVEVNFVLSGEGQGGIDLVLVKADTKIAEERVQKAIVRMKPIVSAQEIATEFAKQRPQDREKALNDSVKFMLKGRPTTSEESIPKVE